MVNYSRALVAAVALLTTLIRVESTAAQDPGTLEQQIRSRLAIAQQAERSQNYGSARRAYREILKLQPDWALIHQSLALTYHLENLFRPAIEEFRKAIQLDEQLWGSYLFLGMDYYKTNQFNKAVPALEKSLVLNREGAESEARFWLGLSFSALGKHGEATEQLQRLTQVRADDIEVLFHLARAHDRHASTLFETIGRIDPRSSLVHLLQAERSAAEDRPALARFEYQQALQLRPDVRGLIPALGKFTGRTLSSPSDRPESPLGMSLSDMRANYELGEFFLTHGAADQGLDHLKRVASQTPTDADSERLVQASQQRLEKWKPDSATADGRTSATAAEPPLLAALQALKSGQYETAIQGFVPSLTDTDGRLMRLFLVRAYMGANRHADAETEAEKLLDEDPDNLEALYWLGRIHKKRAALALDEMIQVDPDSYRVHQLAGERHEEDAAYEKALESYRKALEKRPALAGIRYAIGNVYWKTRQFDPAEKWLRGELERNPHHGLAHYRLGSLYAEQGKPDQSISHLKQALAANSGLIAARLELGRALMARERYQEAVSEFEMYAQADAENDRIHYLLGNAYKKLGRTAEAQSEMRKFRELNQRRLERVQGDVRKVSEALAEPSDSASPDR